MIRASLWSEKDHLNIDIYLGFIEIFGLFWDRREPLVMVNKDGNEHSPRVSENH